MDIDWTDASCHVTDDFTVGDAIMLHKWNRLATEDDGLDDAMKAQIISTLQKAEEVRAELGCPMNSHCTFRSTAYNLITPGAPEHDVHSQGLALDFDCAPNLTTDEVKEKLMPKLEALGIRMEDNGSGASWVHFDRHPVIHSRFFKP